MNKKKKIVRQVEGNRLAILRTLPLPERYTLAGKQAALCTTYLVIKASHNNLQIGRTKRLVFISLSEGGSCSVQKHPCRETKSDAWKCLQKQLFSLPPMSPSPGKKTALTPSSFTKALPVFWRVFLRIHSCYMKYLSSFENVQFFFQMANKTGTYAASLISLKFGCFKSFQGMFILALPFVLWARRSSVVMMGLCSLTPSLLQHIVQ